MSYEFAAKEMRFRAELEKMDAAFCAAIRSGQSMLARNARQKRYAKSLAREIRSSYWPIEATGHQSHQATVQMTL